MKRILLPMLVAATLSVLVPAGVRAQKISFDLDTTTLAAKAIETVEITLDGELLRLAGRFLATADADEPELGRLLRRLEGIYVRSYTFDSDGAYDSRAIAAVRARIGAGWQKIVNVRSADSDDVEVYTKLAGDRVEGVVIIAAQPRQLTFINIVGPVDLAELSLLEGQFAIPRISKKDAKEK
ncbi:MAG TPA: DUF4252 domain-containing protein [Thermoanaerobaculia bacterium]|nr:DUF4252 domain-containing protein [Thermoanaerobaculia bacterium]